MNQRMTTIWTVVLLLFAGFAASAETSKYLVRFKSANTFQNVVQNMKAQTFSSFGADVAPMRLFNSNATVNEALEHVQLLIIESNDEKAIESLRRHPAVALVEKEIFHPLPRPMATWGANSSDIFAKKPKKPKRVRMEIPWGITAVKAQAAWAKSNKGQNVRVMVLDTGLDKNHPSLSSRLEKGKNFAGGSSADFSDTIGHGTHVAGTILADGVSGGLVGVAPKAKLLMGKVCGAVGCSSAAIAGGINWAVSEKVDVVNMSLGGMFISEAELQAIRAAEAAGVFIAAASGNDGTGRVSFPAAVETISAVGATDITSTKAQFSQWGPELDVVAPGVDVISAVPTGTGRSAVVKADLGKGMSDVKALPFVGSPLRTVNAPVVFAGLGKTTDVANLNLTGKIALISRGEIPFKEKVANVLAKGAVAAIIFNNAPGLIQGSLTEDGSEAAIPAAMIEKTLGEEAKTILAQGQSVSFSLSIDPSDYASFQGTSMASPHVAGVAALIRATNKGLTPLQVRDLLKATATPLGPNLNNEYGAGLVNAEAAVDRASTLSPALIQVAN